MQRFVQMFIAFQQLNNKAYAHILLIYIFALVFFFSFCFFVYFYDKSGQASKRLHEN